MISESVKVIRNIYSIYTEEKGTYIISCIYRGGYYPKHFHTFTLVEVNSMPFNDLTDVKACVKVGVKVKLPYYSTSLFWGN